GENLALNLAGHGFPVVVYNRTAERTRRFLAERARGFPIHGAYTLAEFVQALDLLFKSQRCPRLREAFDGPLVENRAKLANWRMPCRSERAKRFEQSLDPHWADIRRAVEANPIHPLLIGHLPLRR
ncbi:MAG: hypothetical protein C4345_12160, partial [Chloroflexota bacterium]